MILNKIVFGSFILLIMACNSSKKVAVEDVNKLALQNKNQQMLAEGYLSGTIIYSSKEGDCAYTIKVNDDSNRRFDPINLEELDNNFMKHDENIWFKFQGLRMKNRCLNANPIRLNKIIKREE